MRARRELPGFSTLDRMVAAIRTETNTALYTMLAARIDLAAKARLTRLLWLDPRAQRVRPAEDTGEGGNGTFNCAWAAWRRSTSSLPLSLVSRRSPYSIST